MLSWFYHRDFPEGKVFDTEGREAPYPPGELAGWFDCRSKIHTTQDELIDRLVRRELSKQSSDRIEMEREFERKTGDKPPTMAKDETLVKVLDEPLAPVHQRLILHAKRRK